MRKVIAAINMTIDGFCDHTAIVPDEEIHQHYADLLRDAGAILYGRTTYELMLYWRDLVINPSGDKSMDDFAEAMDRIPKIVFSRTLKPTDPAIAGWETATLASRGIAEEVSALKQQSGKDIFVGSPGLIVSLTQLGLIDQYQLCVHPVIAGSGLPLFKETGNRISLTLLETKRFDSGAMVLYYEAGQ